jgi:hypothetical protein
MYRTRLSDQLDKWQSGSGLVRRRAAEPVSLSDAIGPAGPRASVNELGLPGSTGSRTTGP